MNIFTVQESPCSVSQNIKKLNFQTPKYQISRALFAHDSKLSPSV